MKKTNKNYNLSFPVTLAFPERAKRRIVNKAMLLSLFILLAVMSSALYGRTNNNAATGKNVLPARQVNNVADNFRLKKKDPKDFSMGGDLCFVENKGQVTDQNGKARNDIQFKLAAANGLTIFVGDGAIHYQFSKCNNPEALKHDPNSKDPNSKVEIPSPIFDMYRMDVELVGANKHAKVIKEKEQAYYENYYTTATGENVATAHTYKRVIYKDIYPNIDWVFYTSGSQLKHEFLVRDGGNVSDIKLKYGGATGLKINNDGSLAANTPQGTITEETPYTYQKDGKKITSSFKLDGDILSYTTGEYTGDLVIDPSINWGTYYGGSSLDISTGVVTDGSGNVYIVGYTQSSGGTNIVTAGAHQTAHAGSNDPFLVKFNSSGVRQWGTYYGDSGNDSGYGVAVDGSGNVYITGVITSGGTALTTVGAHQVTHGGSQDAFLAKFNSSGVRLWATYYGSSGDEQGRSVATDGSGNVYLTGYSTSSGGTAIATAGSHQAAFGGGVRNAFLAKFNSSGVRQWATYYGGSGDDRGQGVATDGSGNVYITGMAGSSGGTTIATAGSHQAANGGGIDAYLAKFNSSGVRQWATYYGGGGTDYSAGLAIDGSGNLYITGYTTSSGGTAIATAGSHQVSHGGGVEDAFLAKFNSSGTRQWATYYGGTSFEECYGVATDGTGSVYITGVTPTSGGTVIATAGSHQPAYGGGIRDAFLVQFNSSGVRQWATYYGGNSEDHGWGVAADGSGNVYITGYSMSTAGIATGGSHQAANAGIHDAFLASFSFVANAAPTFTGGSPQSLTVCQTSTGNAINSLLAVSDADAGQTLTWSVTSAPAHGSLSGVASYTATSTGSAITPSGMTYTPTAGYSGTDAFTIQVSDGAATATTTVNVTVKPTPTITSVTPLVGIPASAVTIAGTGFEATTTNNIVYFGATRATVTTATTTTLSVTVPAGATYDRVNVATVNGCGLQAASQHPYLPNYNNSAYVGSTVNFGTRSSISTASIPQGIAIGDIDGDGKPDIAMVNGSVVSVYRNISTSGSLTSSSFAANVNFTPGTLPIDVLLKDVDGDGKLDMLVANYISGSVSVFLNTAISGSITTGSFAAKVDLAALAATAFLAAGDIDGDGRPDIAACNAAGGSGVPVSVFRNTCTPGVVSFATKVDFASGSQPFGIAIGDLDGDGKPEMAVANVGSNIISVFRNTASAGSITSGSFAAKVDYTAASPSGMVIADINGDGKPELATGAVSGTSISVFQNNCTSGTISFGSAVNLTTGADPRYLGAGDIDGDGKPDLVINNFGGSTVSIFRNTGVTGTITSGSFDPKVDFAAGTSPQYVAVGDLDGDSRPDVSVGHNGFTISFLRNDPLRPITGTAVVCAGSTTTLGNATPNGTWSSGNTGIAIVGSVSGIVTGVAAGTVNITYAGTAGVSFTGNVTYVTVTVNPRPTVSAGSNVIICTGNSTILTATGGTTYTWSPGTGLSATTGSGVTASPSSPTTYTITGTDANTCSNTATVTVSVNSVPTISAGSSGGGCSGTTLTASGGTTYTWSPPTGLSATTGAGITANPSGATTYTVTGTTGGCSNTATVNVTPSTTGLTFDNGSTQTMLVCAHSIAVPLSVQLAASGSSTGTFTYSVITTPAHGTLTGFPASVAAGTGVYPTATNYQPTFSYTGSDVFVVSVSNGSCTVQTTVNVTVSGVMPAPIFVTGGGGYCTGGTGVNVGISGSAVGIGYQLYQGVTPVGSPSPGIGAGFNFGPQTLAGTYTIMAINGTTGCMVPCYGSANVVVYPLPTVFSVTGGGGFCTGGTGVNIGTSSSVSGVTYKLYRTGIALAVATVSGSGAALNFGLLATAGTYSVTATSAVYGCVIPMAGSATVTVNPLPAAYSVTGGGSYCTGGTGVAVGLSNSVSGINYQLYRGTTAVGGAVAGSGSAISFGLQTVAGTYTVKATDATTGCGANMTGSVTVGTSSAPTAYTVTGGGAYCSGGTGVNVGLSGSQAGVSYQLYLGGIVTGSPMSGTGGVLSFGLRTAAGTYTIVGTGACTTTMTGSVNVTVNSAPNLYTVTGGGSSCSGSGGVAVGLSGSDAGVNYQLYRGSSAIGSPMAGTGSALSFPPQTVNGTYTVIATATTGGCTRTMSGSATVTLTSLPTAVSMTGGGGFCSGGTGVNVGLAGSASGINYQLYLGGIATGSPVAGTGTAISFGLQTVAGSYTAVATSTVSGCSSGMTGTATVIVYSLPAIHTVTGGGSRCITGSGVSIGLGSSSTGVTYRVYLGTSPQCSPVYGTGGSLYFGLYSTAGTYTVIASNTGTNSCSSTMSGTATVSVNPTPTISSTYYTVAPAGTRTVTATPSGGTWTSSLTYVATIGSASGVVTGVANGTTWLYYTSPAGCLGYHSFAVTSSGFRPGTDDSLQGMSTMLQNSEMRVLPNPNKGAFSIKGQLGERAADEEDMSICITNMLGQSVYTRNITVKNREVNEQVNLEHQLSPGMYIVMLRSKEENRVFHVVIE